MRMQSPRWKCSPRMPVLGKQLVPPLCRTSANPKAADSGDVSELLKAFVQVGEEMAWRHRWEMLERHQIQTIGREGLLARWNTTCSRCLLLKCCNCCLRSFIYLFTYLYTCHMFTAAYALHTDIYGFVWQMCFA